MTQKLKEYLTFKRNPVDYILRFTIKKVWKWLPSKAKAVYHYEHTTGQKMDFNNPKDLNQKILKSLFYSDTSQWSLLADKYRVREYVTSKGLSNILIPLYGVWKKAEEIDFDSLPRPCIIKTNNASATNFILREGENINYDYLRKELNTALKIKFGRMMGEIHYDKIEPCIIAEKFMPANQQDFASSSLIDYKIWCFNGEPYLFFVIYDRKFKELGKTKVELKGLHWEDLKYKFAETSDFEYGDGRAVIPPNIEELLEIARVLSKGFPEVRVDLYNINGKPYFSELTFTSAAFCMNYFTNDALIEMGKLVKC